MPFKLLFLFFVLILIFRCEPVMSSDVVSKDVVILKDGQRMKGYIIDRLPGAEVKIQNEQGDIYNYPATQIVGLRRETEGRPDYKDARLALLYSALPGGGQLYCHRYLQGGIAVGLAAAATLFLYSEGVQDFTYNIFSSQLGDKAVYHTHYSNVVNIALGSILLWSLVSGPAAVCGFKFSGASFWEFPLGRQYKLNIMPDLVLTEEPRVMWSERINPSIGIKVRLSL